ncbi:pilus assembly PilX family protein [Billgrantia kenyensis]|uniref:DUF7305 domain-containing protein n=1 Tax=Billgrantia kenyensis TaxID=321266 RepID=A0A7V9VYI9_9GAMM|nr:pilus assembly PilX N-terminal domain-containing protein [Halomonas kenyensis]MBA2777769.1 hypothetical protein [Halomonas kenyensis]MCG6661240.1 hypothetical protein [Halomonas kenyensis]
MKPKMVNELILMDHHHTIKITKHQKGAALIVVLSLLTITLALGFSAFNISLTSERLAGNYRLQAQSEMNSESAASKMLNFIVDNNRFETSFSSDEFIDCPRWVDFEQISKNNLTDCQKYQISTQGNVGVACHMNVTNGLCGLESGRYILSIGAVVDGGGALSEGSLVAVGLTNSNGYTPHEPVHGCEGVSLTGSTTITGGVVSGGDITISGGGVPPDNARAHGAVIYPDWWIWDSGKMEYVENYENNIDYNHDLSSPNSSCDPLRVDDIYQRVNNLTSEAMSRDVRIGSWPRVNGIIDHRGVSVENLANGETEILADAVDVSPVSGIEGMDDISFHIIRTGDFNDHNGSIRVTGNNDYLLFVDGDLSLGEGGHGSLMIEEGSTLTIIVSGKTYMHTSLDMLDTPLTTNGKPTFSIYSTSRDTAGQSTFEISDGTHVTGNFYAPYSNIKITGSSTKRGAIRGKTISISGGGHITNESNSMEDEPKGEDNTVTSWILKP